MKQYYCYQISPKHNNENKDCFCTRHFLFLLCISPSVLIFPSASPPIRFCCCCCTPFYPVSFQSTVFSGIIFAVDFCHTSLSSQMNIWSRHYSADATSLPNFHPYLFSRTTRIVVSCLLLLTLYTFLLISHQHFSRVPQEFSFFSSPLKV